MNRSKREVENRAEGPVAERRELLGNLFGVGAIAVLGGCVAGERDPEQAVATQALSGAASWVDTVLPAGTGVSLRGMSGASVGATVLVGGRTAASDGGGGVFSWMADLAAVDDAATIIVPTTGQGAWKRIFSGALDIRWFGAVGRNSAADGPGITAALAAAARRGGGTIFVPAGEYFITRSIVIPRTFGGQPIPISIIGEGAALPATPTSGKRNGSCLRWIGTTTDPTVTYSSTDTGDVYFHSFENLHFLRGDGFPGGSCFAHPYVAGGPNGAARWRSCTIRNCMFAGGPAVPGVALLEISGGWNCLLENVMLDGGDIGIRSVAGSRLELANITTYQKNGGPQRVLYLDGGGGHVIRNCRFEGNSSSLITVTGGAGAITFDQISSEGHHEVVSIDLDDAHDIDVRNVYLGANPFNEPSTALRVSGKCANITVNHGGLKPISIEAGAKHVHIQDVLVDDALNRVFLQDDSGSVSKTVDVVVKVYEHLPPAPIYSYTFTKGMFDAVSLNDGVMWFVNAYNLSGNNLFRGGGVPFWYGIEAGHEGQMITVLVTNNSQIYGNRANLPPKAAPFHLVIDPALGYASVPANSVIRFLFTAGAWYEISRSVNNS